MKRVSASVLEIGETGRYAFVLGAVWTAAVALSLALGLWEHKINIHALAMNQARAIADMDLSFRNWIVERGGVYITAEENTPPDTFLSVPEKHVTTPSGHKLMRVSHAYIMRNISADRARQGLPHSHLTSTKVVDPVSIPDDWEKSVLENPDFGRREMWDQHIGEDLRTIRAFRLKPVCSGCHSAKDNPGGVYGGIGVTVPLASFKEMGAGLDLHWIVGHVLAWFAGVYGLFVSHRRLRRLQAARQESEVKYRDLFSSSRDALVTLAPPLWTFTSGNAAALAMFAARDEAEFAACGPWDLSPRRQPDGRVSSEKAQEMIETALREGTAFFEWTHRRLSGEDFPADVLLTRMGKGGAVFLQATVRDITERKREQARREALLVELSESHEQVKYLSGLIPICASCKKIRNNKGVWESVESYVAEHSDAKFSHSVCPDCGKKLYGEFY